jgi:3-methyladenine DNA glycosylase Tag
MAEGHRDPAKIEAELRASRSRSPAEIAATPDSQVLALMARRIFHAGFSQKVVDDKWPAFETAFHHFAPAHCAFLNDEELDALARDEAIVRNLAKIAAVQANARFVLDLATRHDSAARCFAEWPGEKYVELLDLLKKKGSHLGGVSGMRFLRMLGKPSFVLTPDVVKALIREGVVEKEPSSRKDMQAVQEAMNHWTAQSGRDLTQISRILAWSVG